MSRLHFKASLVSQTGSIGTSSLLHEAIEHRGTLGPKPVNQSAGILAVNKATPAPTSSLFAPRCRHTLNEKFIQSGFSRLLAAQWVEVHELDTRQLCDNQRGVWEPSPSQSAFRNSTRE